MRMMRIFFAILFILFMEIGSGKSLSNSVASIPRAKSKRSRSNIMLFGQGMIHRLIREAKINFCSDLEGLTLQLTRPTDDAITKLELEQITDIISDQYDNPQLLVGLLVKISRKFAEPNVHTKIKTLLLLHNVMNSCKTDAQRALARAVTSLRNEVDEKTESSFFCVDSIEQLAATAVYVVDIEAVELARAYVQYVFNFLPLKGDPMGVSKRVRKGVKSAASVASPSPRSLSQRLSTLLVQGEEVEKACSRRSTGALGQQCLEGVKLDRIWAIETLKQLYNNADIINNTTRDEVEQLLSRLDPSFTRVIPRPRTIRPSEAVPQVVERSITPGAINTVAATPRHVSTLKPKVGVRNTSRANSAVTNHHQT